MALGKAIGRFIDRLLGCSGFDKIKSLCYDFPVAGGKIAIF